MCCTRLAANTGRKKSPSGHHRTTLSSYIFAIKARIDNRKKMLNSNISPTCPHSMMNFSPLTAEIRWRVWSTPWNFNGFRVLAALLHGTLVVGVSQTLRRWTVGATYIRKGGHHVGHWPTFLVPYSLWINVWVAGKAVWSLVSTCHTWALMNYRSMTLYKTALYYRTVQLSHDSAAVLSSVH